MPSGPKRRRPWGGGALAATLAALATLAAPATAPAASAPVITEAFSSQVTAASARLWVGIEANGSFTSYHLEYESAAVYAANLAASLPPFEGAQRVPATGEVNIGSAPGSALVSQQLFSLSAETTYRYRFLAHNANGTAESAPLAFTTRPPAGGPTLADGRAWELVSPVQKNGGAPSAPAGPLGGDFQAAAQGGALTWSSQSSFGEAPEGAPPLSQYISSRGTAGWSSENLSPPTLSGAYHELGDASPYRLFSEDLARGLLFGGDRCRGEGSECPVANPPLAGSDAPAGYEDYYERESSAYTALLGDANAGFLTIAPKNFELRLAGATADLRHVVLKSCAALSANAIDVPAGEGCAGEAQNLYEWGGAGLVLLNLLPGETTGTPGAALAAPAGAISEDGSRVYFQEAGSLYLREGALTKLLPESSGATFQAASANGAIAFFTKATHLFRYSAAGAGQSVDLTPGGGVAGALGASQDGSTVYYQDGAGIERWHEGATTLVTSGRGAALPSDYPPATATARVSADGAQLLFLSGVPLSGYDNTDLNSGQADSEVFLYDAAAGLRCISCNPTEERPMGPSTIPAPTTLGYAPRVLSAGGRAFFESADSLVLGDTDEAPDVYQWEAQGEGSCAAPGGCLSLISGGRSAGGASFIDASAGGADAFFLTEGSLVGADGGGADIYDARVGGGFAEPSPPIACEGDSCQSLPSAPTDPTLTTLLSGPGNPPVRYPGAKKRCKKGNRLSKGKCVPKKTAGRHNRRAGDSR
jgi:hypothetical protein